MRSHQQLAFRVAYTITGSERDAEEAAQDAFVKAYFALSKFRAGAPFRPWLLTIVANEARNRRLSAGRHPLIALDDATDLPPGDDSPEAAALDAERARELVACLNGLRVEDRAILTYRYFLELSEAEMAAALGIARGTVKSRLSRALGRARAKLEGKANGHG